MNDTISIIYNDTLIDLLNRINDTEPKKYFQYIRNSSDYSRNYAKSNTLIGPMTSLQTISCLLLGILSLILNSFVIVALVRNRRRVLKNVFYVIVLNCAILDLMRGFCLTATFGIQLFVIPVTDINVKVKSFQMIRYLKWLLKQGNVMTILNLLVFTSNEFIVIRYPLHYRRYCRRRVILSVLLACWIITILYSVGLSLTDARENNLPSILIAIMCYLCLFVVLMCYGFILRTIRKFHRAEESGEFNGEGQKINNRPTKHCHGKCERGQSKKWRNHLMSRHKYLIVIGTVLFVNILFLVPYSGIQILSFLQVQGWMPLSMFTSILQQGWTIMIGIHSVCQPLCYFRMNEFRRLACCHGRTPWNKTKSFSHNKSFAVTKSHIRDDDQEGMEMLMDSPKPRQPLLDHACLIIAPINPSWGPNVVKFRAYGHQLSKVKDSAVERFKNGDKNILLRSRSETELIPIKKKSKADCALP